MTRAKSICFVLAIAVAPLLSSCSVKTLPTAGTGTGGTTTRPRDRSGRAGEAEADRKLEG